METFHTMIDDFELKRLQKTHFKISNLPFSFQMALEFDVHKGQTLHQCKICCKTFELANQLELHYWKIHKEKMKVEKTPEAKKFQCNTCDLCFRTKGDLKICT